MIPKSKNESITPKASRRKFLTSLALGASAAPFLSLTRGLANREDAAASLCYSSKRVLGPSDLQYLGVIRVPAEGVDMVFSQGGMTGRKVGGQIRLLMYGSRNVGDPVYELADPGSYNQNPAQAPRMSLVRAWGNIYGSARTTWMPDGSQRENFADYRYMSNLHYNQATDLLYWTYYDVYNVARTEDWCLGATRLSDSGPVAYGPWRPSGGDRKGPWRCVNLSTHPGSGEMLCGSILMSGNIGSPWGPDMWGGQWPGVSTPAGFMAPDIPVSKYLTYYPMVGNVGLDGSFSGPIRSFRRPGDYTFEPISGDATITHIDPLKNGGRGSWTDLDSVNGMAWIDLPDVHGVVFTGRLASGHVWYRNTGQGNGACTHGQQSPVDVTGPVSTDGYPMMIVYDPNDLMAVRSGAKVDYTVDPVHLINLQSSFGVRTAPITEVGTAKSLGGSYFDPASRKLYVAAPQADTTIPGLMNPMVHVFRIA